MITVQHLVENPSEPSAVLVPAAGDVTAELNRILDSQAFRTAPSQRKFLKYSVEQALDGKQSLLKEYSIGIEVFERGDSFDPRLDPIVRTQAIKLRARLAKYYETEGIRDAVRIELPKGSYAPSFRFSDIGPARIGAEPIDFPLEAVDTETAEMSGRLPTRLATGRIVWLTAAVLVLSLGLTWLLMYSRPNRSSAPSASVAVLPFLNVSDDKSKEGDFFSDGLTDELIESLGSVPGVHVVARTSVFQFKGKPSDVREIGRKLNVKAVLEGTVRQYEGRLRITTQLDDTATGFRLWSRSYDREISDALKMQREISQAIVGSLGVELSPGRLPQASQVKPRQVNPIAYADFLKGIYFLEKATPQGNERAIALFKDAVARDPLYSSAWAGLAHCYIRVPVFTDTPVAEVVPMIRSAAQKSLDLDYSNGAAHLDLAAASEFSLDWAAADREYRLALKLSPGTFIIHRNYSTYLLKTGRLNEALAEARIAKDLDPISPYVLQGVGRSLYFLREYDEAAAEFHRALDLEPNFGMALQGLGLAYIDKRMYAEGVAETEKAREVMGGDYRTTGQLGYAYARAGNTAEARRILNNFLSRSGHGRVHALAVAEIYVGLGQKDEAFNWLREAVAEVDVDLFLKADPLFDPLRSDPRFTDLLRQMKLS